MVLSKMMKCYIAARTAQEELVREMYKKIRQQGHEISYDWTHTTAIMRPYAKHEDSVRAFAEEEIRGILDADIFIILSDPQGTGCILKWGQQLRNAYKIMAKALAYTPLVTTMKQLFSTSYHVLKGWGPSKKFCKT